MKRVTKDDFVVGTNLLCVVDRLSTPSRTIAGEIVTVVRLRSDIVALSKSTGTQSSFFMTSLLRSSHLIFVNYDKMTDKEKFIHTLTGKVTLE